MFLIKERRNYMKMECPHGHELDATYREGLNIAVYCPECGATLCAIAIPYTHYHCSHCYKDILNENTMFCPYCGQKRGDNHGENL